ncbi:hypothetical protein SAMN05444280_1277 [Tangfeifania diversioriginum]|uniref:Uncharacterized protein n=1 Tax=Tangfeifania diversioriginum TaxID=1168035 RepID=A0A1M6LIY4_9BACT|nr:hypothetical protein SAMN05444280_1277 [Tangfeifania diversioriginum]
MASFFDILKTSDLYNVVDHPGKFRFGRSTILSFKIVIFAEVNLLKVNLFF